MARLADTQNMISAIRSAPSDHAPDILKHLSTNLDPGTHKNLFSKLLDKSDPQYQSTIKPFQDLVNPAGSVNAFGPQKNPLQFLAQGLGQETPVRGLTAMTTGVKTDPKLQSLAKQIPKGVSLESTRGPLNTTQYSLRQTTDLTGFTMEQFEKEFSSLPGLGTSGTDASFFRALAGKPVGEQFKMLRDADTKTINAALQEQSEWNWYNAGDAKAPKEQFKRVGETVQQKRDRIAKVDNILTKDSSALGKVNNQTSQLLGLTPLTANLGG